MEAKNKKKNPGKKTEETVHASEKAEADNWDEEKPVNKKRTAGGVNTGAGREEAKVAFTESNGGGQAGRENSEKNHEKSSSGNDHKSIGKGSSANSCIKKNVAKKDRGCRSANEEGADPIDREKSSIPKERLESSLGDEISLSKCMLRLLHSPAAGCEEAEKLKESGFRGEEISQTMLLAQAMLTKAVKNGDVSAYREVKALIDLENDGNGQFERLLNGIREAIRFEQSGVKEKGPD